MYISVPAVGLDTLLNKTPTSVDRSQDKVLLHNVPLQGWQDERRLSCQKVPTKASSAHQATTYFRDWDDALEFSVILDVFS